MLANLVNGHDDSGAPRGIPLPSRIVARDDHDSMMLNLRMRKKSLRFCGIYPSFPYDTPYTPLIKSFLFFWIIFREILNFFRAYVALCFEIIRIIIEIYLKLICDWEFCMQAVNSTCFQYFYGIFLKKICSLHCFNFKKG